MQFPEICTECGVKNTKPGRTCTNIKFCPRFKNPTKGQRIESWIKRFNELGIECPVDLDAILEGLKDAYCDSLYGTEDRINKTIARHNKELLEPHTEPFSFWSTKWRINMIDHEYNDLDNKRKSCKGLCEAPDIMS